MRSLPLACSVRRVVIRPLGVGVGLLSFYPLKLACGGHCTVTEQPLLPSSSSNSMMVPAKACLGPHRPVIARSIAAVESEKIVYAV